MQKASYYLSAMLMVACFTQPATAQFEGEITFKTYEYSEGQEKKSDGFNLYVRPDRILLQGENQYQFMESIQTEGVLVRLDKQDFVFLTGDNKALQIAKSDITSMMKMFDNDAQKTADDYDIRYNRTEERKNIRGHQAEKFIFREEEDGENDYSVVWMTKEIDVNWGMLAEPWNDNMDALISSSFPADIIFKEKYFPLRVEVYSEDELRSVLEATEVSKTSVDRSLLEVSSDIKLMNFQQYLFQKMNER